MCQAADDSQPVWPARSFATGVDFRRLLTEFTAQTTPSVMTTVDIQAARTHLSRLIEQAIAGEEIVIARAGKPLVRLMPFVQDKNPRTLGLLRGQIREASDCWENDPAIEAAFGWSAICRPGL